MEINKLKQQQENKLKLVENIDKVIISTCESVMEDEHVPGEREGLITALASLIKARAVID